MMVMVSREELEKMLNDAFGTFKESVGMMFNASVNIPERFKYHYTFMEIQLDIWDEHGKYLDSFLVFKENSTGNIKYLVNDSKF